MLHSKLFIALLSILTVAAVSIGTAAFLNSQSANSKPNDKKELNGSGSSDNGKSAHSPAPPSTTTTLKATPVANGKDKPKDTPKDNESKKDFTISGTAPVLYPGATKQLALTVSNPNNFAIKVTSLNVTTSAASAAGCTISSVTADSFSGALIADKNATATTSIAIRMADSTPNACQGANFTLVYSGIGEKA